VPEEMPEGAVVAESESLIRCNGFADQQQIKLIALAVETTNIWIDQQKSSFAKARGGGGDHYKS